MVSFNMTSFIDLRQSCSWNTWTSVPALNYHRSRSQTFSRLSTFFPNATDRYTIGKNPGSKLRGRESRAKSVEVEWTHWCWQGMFIGRWRFKTAPIPDMGACWNALSKVGSEIATGEVKMRSKASHIHYETHPTVRKVNLTSSCGLN
jgi:hypothetical protein